MGDGGFTMLMGEFATAVKYDLPITVVIIKNNTLGMIKWEQMVFLGNPEYGVEQLSVPKTEKNSVNMAKALARGDRIAGASRSRCSATRSTKSSEWEWDAAACCVPPFLRESYLLALSVPSMPRTRFA